MTKFPSLCAAVVLSLAPVVVAQSAQVTKEQFRLQFEISKNGTVLQQPILKIAARSAGAIVLNDGPTLELHPDDKTRLIFTLTPSRIDANAVRVDCDITIESVTPQLWRAFRMVRFNLRGHQQESRSFTFGRDSFDVTAAVAR
jgi:hypothetical protein